MPESRISKFKEVIVTVREILIVAIILIVLIFPRFIIDTLVGLGLSEVGIGDVKLRIEKEVNLKEAEINEEMQERLGDLQLKIDSLNEEIANCTTNPAVQKLVKDLNTELTDSKASIEKRSDMLKSEIMLQQNVINQQTNKELPQKGWLYVGWISEDKKTWKPGSPKNIDVPTPEFEKGQVLTLTQDAYLRDEGEVLSQSKAKIQAVIPKDTRMIYEKIIYSKARKGGWFGWILVSTSLNESP